MSSNDNSLLEEALRDAQNGAAICFLGAGFSRGVLTQGGVNVPDVDELSNKIWDIISEPKVLNASLSDLAEACEDSGDRKRALLDLMIRNYTLCVPTSDQTQFFKIPWRAIFTTNFDDIAERVVKNGQIVTPSFPAKNLDPKKRPIYYLHGRALDLLEGRLDPSIVISETNYLQVKDKNRDLYSALENEIHTASRIFFVGYSLRDSEIASTLFSISNLKDKSIVVIGPNDSTFSTRRLEKFGTVFPIGLSKLVNLYLTEIDNVGGNSTPLRLNFAKRILPSPIAPDVSIDDVYRLLLAGEFSYSSYARFKNDSQSDNPYCVSRERSVNVLFDTISAGINRILISSDLGNGKSFVLSEVIYTAHSKGYEVIFINTGVTELYLELDSLLKEGSRKMFIIDDLVRHKKAARYIGKRLPSNSALVVTSGSLSDSHEFSNIVDELSGPVREIDVNLLNAQELSAWSLFLERWGFWEERIELSQEERFSFLKDRCGSENRAIIVSLFRTSAIAKKINEIVEIFIRKNQNMSKAFIAILINSLCRHHVEWSRLVGWLEINESLLKKAIIESRVLNFMSESRTWYSFTSAELADFILSKYDFNVEDIVAVYVKIVRETAYSANDPRSGFDARENLKELMRFRFLTRLFSNPENGNQTINAVYHRLSSVPRIRENDQFWLQYAMAKMEVADLQKAETFINTSLGLARKKGLDYAVRQIIDQRSRLLFRKNCNVNIRHSTKDIELALSDLTSALNSHDGIVTHSLRASGDILNFIEAKVDVLTVEELESLRSCLNLMNSKLPDGQLPKSQKGETNQIRKNVRSALIILANY